MVDDGDCGPYHDWSDTSFDWKALNDAARYIETNCRRWGRIGVWTKEKYGTLRVSTTGAWALEYDFLYSLLYPGHIYIKWPKWVRTYIDWPLGKFLRCIGIISLVHKYQLCVLKFFWKRAAKKWPHISDEILDDYEWEFKK